MSAAIYNSLPHVEEVNASIKDRDALFTKLAPLLHMCNDLFGVVLVHSHTKLKDGEIMLTNGNVTKPSSVTQGVFPSHWLATGEPYEFSTTPTAQLPAALLSDFQEIVGKDGPLGLSYVGYQDKDLVQCETSKDGVQTVTYHTAKALPTHDKATEVGWVADGSTLRVEHLYLWLNGRHFKFPEDPKPPEPKKHEN